MLASDLQVSLPLVNRRTSAWVAARLLARHRAVGVVVADETGAPIAVVSPTDVLRIMVPGGSVTDAGPSHADQDARTIGDILDDETIGVARITHVDSDDTLATVASKLGDSGAQIAVVDRAPQGARFVTLPTVMEAILVANGDDDGPS